MHHFICLKINPANLDIFIVLKFSNFYMVTVYLILLTYLSVYLFLTQLHNYGFNINTINFANVLLFKYFDFCCSVLNVKRMLLLDSGDIETNSGPRKSFIKFYFWTLNGVAAHGFLKMPLIEAFPHFWYYMCVGNFLRFKHTFSDTFSDTVILRPDHPDNTKYGGLCLYYKNYLPVIKRTNLPDL